MPISTFYFYNGLKIDYRHLFFKRIILLDTFIRNYLTYLQMKSEQLVKTRTTAKRKYKFKRAVFFDRMCHKELIPKMRLLLVI